MLASLDQSLARMGLDYVDVFYSPPARPDTPLEETISALVSAVVSGKAFYTGISSYPPDQTAGEPPRSGRAGSPLLIHQTSYSISTAGPSTTDC